MLDLSQRVSKRARHEFADVEPTNALTDLGPALTRDGGLSARAGGPGAPLRRWSLHLNVDPAGALASTPTRVTQPLIALAKNNDARAWPRDEAAPCVRLDPERIARVASTPQRDADAGYTWDSFLDCAGSGEVAYDVDFPRVTKDHILRAGANAAVGLESALVAWDEPSMQLRVASVLVESKFGGLLMLLARCGSYVRRLRRAAGRIRELVSGTNGGRTALALATAIEAEVRDLAQLPRLGELSGLAGLYAHCYRVHALALNLAELVGCADLNEPGRLLRVPPATTLLNRAYDRALLQQSQRWHGAMLWRLVTTTMGPWLAELSFVVGITEPAVLREASADMQAVYFPSMFLRVDEETATVSVDDKLLPRFVPRAVADAAVRCYNMLVILGMKGHAAPALACTSLSALSIRGQPAGCGALNVAALAHREAGSVQHGVHAVLASLESPANPGLSTSPKADSTPPSVESEIWRTLAPVLVRCSELDILVKQALHTELASLRRIVVGVFMLGDGQFWSLFQDLVDAMYGNWQEATSYLPAMNALLNETHSGASFVVDPDTPGSLQVSYDLPSCLSTALSGRCLQGFHSVFARLLNLHYQKQGVEFALFAAQLAGVAHEIDAALNDPRCGFQETAATFERIFSAL